MAAKTEIHLYDSNTGMYLESFSSFREAERIKGWYRGAISDALKRRFKSRNGILCSTIRYDVYPGFVEVEKLVEEPEKSECKSNTRFLSKSLTEQELRQKHDMFFMVKNYVENIPVGRFVDETQMLRDLGILGKPRYRDAIMRPELKEYKGKVDGTTYYGSIESIKKLKSEGVLQ